MDRTHAPEQPSYETRELESGLSVDDAKRVSQGTTLVIFFGLLRYSGMGTSYETQFCWYYSGGDSNPRSGLQTWTGFGLRSE